MQVLNETLLELMVGEASMCGNLAVFPLFTAKAAAPPDYVTLDEALESGRTEVTEVSEGGHVPELCFANRLDRPVLLVDGEELVGAKQNRILNLSILIGAGHTVTIPVSCVESGRWQYKSRRFASGGKNLYGKLRAQKMAAVTESLRELNSRRSDQGAIWDDIAAKSFRMEARCETGAMDAIYEEHEEQLKEYVRTLKPAADQAGAVFLINGEVAGLELFDSPLTLAQLMEKLVGSYAMDALDAPADQAKAPAPEGVRAFIERLKSAASSEHRAVDLGVDVRLSGERLAGGALVIDGRIVHLSAFNLREENDARRGEIPV